MKKSRFMFAIMLLSMLLISACQNSDKELTIGVIKDGTYKNDYFGISLNFPKEWDSYSAGALGQDISTDMVEIDKLKSDNAISTEDLEKAEVLSLLSASEYPRVGEESGPSVNVTALKLGSFGGVKTSKEYVDLLKKDLGPPFVLKDVTSTQIGGKNMDAVNITLEHNGVTETQDAYFTVVNDYVLGVVVTYVNEESKTETNQILQSISFN